MRDSCQCALEFKSAGFALHLQVASVHDELLIQCSTSHVGARAFCILHTVRTLEVRASSSSGGGCFPEGIWVRCRATGAGRGNTSVMRHSARLG